MAPCLFFSGLVSEVDLSFVSVSQVGLSFQVDLKFSCEQKLFSFRGEMSFQNNSEWHSGMDIGNLAPTFVRDL